MITENQGLTMLAGANPMPDTNTIDVALEAHAYLANLEQRSSEMVQLETKPVKQQDPKRGRLTLALAAFIAVIVIGAVTLLARNNEPTPPATEPTTTTQSVEQTTATTTAAPPTSVAETAATTLPVVENPLIDEALAVATAFMEARAARDIEAVRTHAVEGHIGGFYAGSLDFLATEMELLEAIGWSIEVDGCTVTNPDLANTRVTCFVTHSSVWAEGLGVGPYLGEYYMRVMYAGDSKLGVPITETTVTEAFLFQFPQSTWIAEAWNPTVAWVEANHPEGVDTVLVPPTETCPGCTADVALTPESIDLWRQYTVEFIAEQSG